MDDQSKAKRSALFVGGEKACGFETFPQRVALGGERFDLVEVGY